MYTPSGLREGNASRSFDNPPLAVALRESREGSATKIDTEYSAVERLTDGTQVRLRLLRPSDRDALLAGFQRLSPESRYRRFLSPTPRLSKKMLRQLIETDDWNHLAIVAERVSKDSAPAEGLGIARFIRLGDAPDTAEAAVVVDDAVHRRGLGRLLLLTLVEAARERGIKKFRAYVLPDNEPAQRLLRDLDEHVKARVEDDLRVFELPLPEAIADTAATDLIYRFLRSAGEGVIMILRSLTGADMKKREKDR
jgi:RimJ/RimL family protein N-acetyltransferase